MKSIYEFLLSKYSNTTYSKFHELKGIIGRRWEDTYDGALKILDANEKTKNFSFLMDIILYLINEHDFIFGKEVVSHGEYTFICVNDTDAKLTDETSKIIRMFKFGDEGISVDIFNCKTFVDMAFIVSEVDFEIYYAKSSNVEEFEKAYIDGAFDYDCVFSEKQKEITNSDIDKIKKIVDEVI